MPYAMVIDMHDLSNSKVVQVTQTEFKAMQKEEAELSTAGAISDRLSVLVHGMNDEEEYIARQKKKIVPVTARPAVIQDVVVVIQV